MLVDIFLEIGWIISCDYDVIWYNLLIESHVTQKTYTNLFAYVHGKEIIFKMCPFNLNHLFDPFVFDYPNMWV
jgi:hypothetical protein